MSYITFEITNGELIINPTVEKQDENPMLVDTNIEPEYGSNFIDVGDEW